MLNFDLKAVKTQCLSILNECANKIDGNMYASIYNQICYAYENEKVIYLNHLKNEIFRTMKRDNYLFRPDLSDFSFSIPDREFKLYLKEFKEYESIKEEYEYEAYSAPSIYD